MDDFYTVGFGKAKDYTVDVVGGKGFGLLQMSSLHINVPPAVIIPTTYCLQVIAKKVSPMALSTQVYYKLEAIADKFGYMPLFSARSGAKESMPGMCSTILNLGLCESNLKEWSDRIGERTTLDSYRRLIQMFGDVVFNRPSYPYEKVLTDVRANEGVATDAELSIDGLKVVIAEFLKLTPDFPQTFKMQLRKAIGAVFASWNTERAITYRKLHNISNLGGTAVTLQAMVFGNFNDDSCTGVLFTRSPSTGENKIFGEYLVNAQGEDVVAGIRTPLPLENLAVSKPELFNEIISVANKLEIYNKDMQDIEFTVQDGELFILQTRRAKRTALAALTVAVDLVKEGLLLSKEEALARVSYKQYCTAQTPMIDPSFTTSPTGSGIPASSGFATGVVAFSAQRAVELSETNTVILLTKETTPDDIAGMAKSVGILTMLGGSSSHAAVIARGMDKVCVVGCLNLIPKVVDVSGEVKQWELNTIPIVEGVTVITLEGSTGNIWVDIKVPMISTENNPVITTFEGWVKELYPYVEKVTSGTTGFLTTEQFDNNTEGLYQAVKNFNGIISLGTGKDTIASYDSHLFELVSPFKDEKVIAEKLDVLAMFDGNGKQLLVKNDYPTTTLDVLVSSGFSLIKEVRTLEEAILAKGVVLFSPDFNSSHAAYKRLLELKKLANEEITPLLFADGKEKDITSFSGKLVVATKEVMMQSALS